LTEAMVLLELQRQPQDAAAVEQAARELVARGSRAALVKGGHLPGDPVDVLAMGQASERFSGARVNVKSRGTGCRLASALAAGLARDRPLRDAVLSARDYVRKVLAGS
jgi:hydroxymethylpyrimidine/phosphomethylpyrimidine kinase